MKGTVKKTDFYGIILFIAFIFWSILTYYIYEKNSYLGRMLNAWGLMALLFGEAFVKYKFDKGEIIRIKARKTKE